VLGHYTNSADKFTQLMVTGLDPIALEVDAIETGVNRTGIKGVGAGLGSGVAGSSASGVGLRGVSPNGRGAVVSGGAAQLRLVPSGADTHPLTGQLGDLFLDKVGRLWFCTKGGNPATWKRVQLA
jgi:hypothetical protein